MVRRRAAGDNLRYGDLRWSSSGRAPPPTKVPESARLKHPQVGRQTEPIAFKKIIENSDIFLILQKSCFAKDMRYFVQSNGRL